MKITERDIKVAIITAVAAFITSVVMLDMNGYINHSDKNSAKLVDEFRLIRIVPGEALKVSPKNANKEAFCADGYLLIRPQKNQSGNQVAGILVDDKDRGVRCSETLPAPAGQ